MRKTVLELCSAFEKNSRDRLGMLANGHIAVFMAYGLLFDFLEGVMEGTLHLGMLTASNDALSTTEDCHLGDLPIFILSEDDVRACTAVGDLFDANQA